MSEGELPPGAWVLVVVGGGVLVALVGLLLARHRQAAWRFARNRFRTSAAYGLGLTLALGVVAVTFWGFMEVVESWTQHTDIFYLDGQAQQVAERIATPALTALTRAATWFGSAYMAVPLVGLAAFALYRRQAWGALAALLVAFGAGEALVYALKFFFDRARPANILVQTHSASFPSGHSFTAMVVYGYFIALLWRTDVRLLIRWLGTVGLVLLIVLVGASRFYLHAHYFTDVAGGFILGLLWLAVGFALTRIVRQRAHPPGLGVPNA